MGIKEFLSGYRGKDIPKELNEFNWGAFLLTFIWGIPHKAWVTLVALPLILIQMPFGLNWLLLGIFQVYCGFKGNMWAYQKDWWKKPIDFRHTQMTWAICAFLLTFIIPLSIFLIALRFVTKSSDNPAEFINNAQCYATGRTLKKVVPKLNISDNMTSAQIAKQMSQRIEKTHLSGDSLIYSAKVGNEDVDVYKITVNKKAGKCLPEEKNCEFRSMYVLPEGLMPLGECVFYTDGKRIVPDEQTQKALDKGINIFKYL